MSTDPTPIPVDLTDMDSIRGALPLVQKRKAEQQAEVAAAQGRLDYWTAIEATLTTVLGDTPTVAPTDSRADSGEPGPASVQLRREPGLPRDPGVYQSLGRGGQMMDSVVRVVNEAGEPIRSRDVTAILSNEGREVTPDSVSNALHYAANRDNPLVRRVKRGVYAPLAWTEPGLLPTGENGGEPE